MPAPRHTPEQKARALELYHDHGPAEASRQTGIPKNTITSWGVRAGLHSVAPERTRAAVEAHQLDVAVVSTRLAALLARTAVDRQEWIVEQHAAKDVRAAQTVAAIAIEKMQLLTGKATQRVETIAAEEAVAIENIVQLRRTA